MLTRVLLIRAILCIAGVYTGAGLLRSRLEVIPPAFFEARACETSFLIDHKMSPFESILSVQPPLLLAIHHQLCHIRRSISADAFNLLISIVCLTFDVVLAQILQRLARRIVNEAASNFPVVFKATPEFITQNLPDQFGSLVLLHPFLVLESVSGASLWTGSCIVRPLVAAGLLLASHQSQLDYNLLAAKLTFSLCRTNSVMHVSESFHRTPADLCISACTNRILLL